MSKTKPKKGRAPARPLPQSKVFSPEAQELRALLRRVPDGFQATLSALRVRPEEARDRVLVELARGVGKDLLPLFRSAALGTDEGLALSALRILPVFGTRAAADVLVEVHTKNADTERARLAEAGARALQARGISVAVGGETVADTEPRLTLRETFVSAPDGVGSRSVTARLQDQYGVWHAIFVLWNDQAGVRDGLMRQMSRSEWLERLERAEERGLAWVSCPPEFARWQVGEALKVSERLGDDVRHLVADFMREVGGPVADYSPPDPVKGIRGLTESAVREGLEGAGCLVAHTEARRWALEAADCEEWARRLLPVAWDAPEVAPIVAEAIESLLTPELLGTYRTRLEDLSRVCAWRGDSDHARAAAAAALAIESGVPAVDMPFCRALMEASLKMAQVLLRRGEDLEKHRWRPKRFAPKRG